MCYIHPVFLSVQTSIIKIPLFYGVQSAQLAWQGGKRWSLKSLPTSNHSMIPEGKTCSVLKSPAIGTDRNGNLSTGVIPLKSLSWILFLGLSFLEEGYFQALWLFLCRITEVFTSISFQADVPISIWCPQPWVFITLNYHHRQNPFQSKIQCLYCHCRWISAITTICFLLFSLCRRSWATRWITMSLSISWLSWNTSQLTF